MKELIERLKRTEYDDLDACKAADALERMAFENLRLAGEVSNRNSRALAGDTATKQFDAMYEEIERLTAHDQFLADANKKWIADCERLTAERDAALAASRHETDLCQQALDTVKEVQAEVDRTIAERDALRAGLAAALDFVGTVAGGASWWDDVWKEHEAAIAGEKT